MRGFSWLVVILGLGLCFVGCSVEVENTPTTIQPAPDPVLGESSGGDAQTEETSEATSEDAGEATPGEAGEATTEESGETATEEATEPTVEEPTEAEPEIKLDAGVESEN
jgi:hypothetical protein